MERLLLFGGTSKLGKEFIKLSSGQEIVAPSSKIVDIGNREAVRRFVQETQPDIVVNFAAIVGTQACENDKAHAWQTNVIGASNVALAAREIGSRYIFTSTASVFDGVQGNYKESDAPNPTYYYALTKCAAEQSACMVDNHAVIRLDFFPREGFKYRKVMTDHYCSKVRVDEAAQLVWEVIYSGYIGIAHIGRPRESLFRILNEYFNDIEPIEIKDSPLPNFPHDLSLQLTDLRKIYE